MIARHEGRILLVSGAIPGERISVRIERVEKFSKCELAVATNDEVDAVRVQAGLVMLGRKVAAPHDRHVGTFDFQPATDVNRLRELRTWHHRDRHQRVVRR